MMSTETTTVYAEATIGDITITVKKRAWGQYPYIEQVKDEGGASTTVHATFEEAMEEFKRDVDYQVAQAVEDNR